MAAMENKAITTSSASSSVSRSGSIKNFFMIEAEDILFRTNASYIESQSPLFL